jgi:hypothetical protein
MAIDASSRATSSWESQAGEVKTLQDYEGREIRLTDERLAQSLVTTHSY